MYSNGSLRSSWQLRAVATFSACLVWCATRTAVTAGDGKAVDGEHVVGAPVAAGAGELAHGHSRGAEIDLIADLGHPVGLFQQRVNILAGRASGAFLLPLGGMASLLSFLVRVARRRIVRPAEKSKAVPNLQNRSAEFRFCRQLLPHDQPASAGSSNTWR